MNIAGFGNLFACYADGTEFTPGTKEGMLSEQEASSARGMLTSRAEQSRRKKAEQGSKHAPGSARAKKSPFHPSQNALVKGELSQLCGWGFKRVLCLVAADQYDVWCLWGDNLRLPIACIREVSITKLHTLEFCIDTFVNGSHVFRATQRPGALHYWVATLQVLCAQCMEPDSRWRSVWAVAKVQARFRGLLGRKRAEIEKRKWASAASAESEITAALQRSKAATQVRPLRPAHLLPPPPLCNARGRPHQLPSPRSWQDMLGTRLIKVPKTAGGLGMRVRYKSDTGVVVWTVEVDKAAWNAGMRVGDILLSIEGHVINSMEQLMDCLSEAEGFINFEVAGQGPPEQTGATQQGPSEQTFATPPRYKYERWPAKPSRSFGGRYLLRYIERTESDACAAEEGADVRTRGAPTPCAQQPAPFRPSTSRPPPPPPPSHFPLPEQQLPSPPPSPPSHASHLRVGAGMAARNPQGGGGGGNGIAAREFGEASTWLNTEAVALTPFGQGDVVQLGQSTPWAVPQLGSCSGRAWQLWAARHSQEDAGPLSVQPLPRVLEPAASKDANFTAFDYPGGARGRDATERQAGEHAYARETRLHRPH